MTVAEPMRRTRAYVVTPADLGPAHRDRMHAIMSEHFVNVDRDAFESDLSEKNWVVRVDDAADRLQGFSTLKLLTHDERGTRTYGFFSGDTVLARNFMSESSWIGVWSRHVFAVAASHPENRSYWVLLTATHRTYRILSDAFVRFYPDPNRPDPEMRRLLTAFVRQKFPDEYDAERGIVALKTPTPYRHADQVEAAGGEHNLHNRFFREINPGYLRGDFLCCLTEITPANLTSLGLRIQRV